MKDSRQPKRAGAEPAPNQVVKTVSATHLGDRPEQMAEIANDSSHVSNTSGQNQSTVQIAPKEQSKEKSKVSLEFTEADMRDITKITQVLDLIK